VIARPGEKNNSSYAVAFRDFRVLFFYYLLFDCNALYGRENRVRRGKFALFLYSNRTPRNVGSSEIILLLL
jgi:hypothetical protein